MWRPVRRKQLNHLFRLGGFQHKGPMLRPDETFSYGMIE
jgi:hypothetical protein